MIIIIIIIFIILTIDLDLGLDFFSNLELIRKRVFRDAMLQTVGDLTSAPETGTNIIDWWEPIDALYVGSILFSPFNLWLNGHYRIDFRKNPLTKRVTTTCRLTKPSMEPLDLGMTGGELS